MELLKDIALNRKIYLLVFCVVFLISISFALYTQHSWEDWYITYRASKNLATGKGLVYTVGQRTHSFTSPLGTLLPALLSRITKNSSDELVLWLLRIIGCSLLGISAVLLLKIAKEISFKVLPAIFLIAMFGIESKIIDFSINGMETAFMIFFLVFTLYVLIVPSRHPLLYIGLSWAGLMWTRPDSFVYFLGIALGYLLFIPKMPTIKNRLALLRFFLGAGIVMLLLYLPWVIWAWHYFGTCIPHTIIAKKLMAPHVHLFNIIFTFPLRYDSSLDAVFMPAAYELGGWGTVPILFSRPLVLLCAFYWCFPFARREARAVSFAIWIGCIYFSIVGVAPWYVASVTLLSILVLSYIIQQIAICLHFLKGVLESNFFRRVKVSIYGVISLLFCVNLILFVSSAFLMRLRQKIIERGNRTQIGLWLKENADSPFDAVFLEPLGYIGFYSQLKMLDFPGLASPEVVAARKKLGTDSFAQLIVELKPDWLVLRPEEIEDIKHQMPALLIIFYRPAKVFDVSQKVTRYAYLPGHHYLEYDQTFTVFKKIPGF